MKILLFNIVFIIIVACGGRITNQHDSWSLSCSWDLSQYQGYRIVQVMDGPETIQSMELSDPSGSIVKGPNGCLAIPGDKNLMIEVHVPQRKLAGIVETGHFPSSQTIQLDHYHGSLELWRRCGKFSEDVSQNLSSFVYYYPKSRLNSSDLESEMLLSDGDRFMQDSEFSKLGCLAVKRSSEGIFSGHIGEKGFMIDHVGHDFADSDRLEILVPYQPLTIVDQALFDRCGVSKPRSNHRLISLHTSSGERVVKSNIFARFLPYRSPVSASFNLDVTPKGCLIIPDKRDGVVEMRDTKNHEISSLVLKAGQEKPMTLSLEPLKVPLDFWIQCHLNQPLGEEVSVLKVLGVNQELLDDADLSISYFDSDKRWLPSTKIFSPLSCFKYGTQASRRFRITDVAGNFVDIDTGRDLRNTGSINIKLRPPLTSNEACEQKGPNWIYEDSNSVCRRKEFIDYCLEPSNDHNIKSTKHAIEMLSSLLEGDDCASKYHSLQEKNSIELEHARLRDLNVFYNLPNLKKLALPDNDISDISPLFSLDQLEELDLSENNITDLTGINALSRLKRLELSDNQIEEDPKFSLVDLEVLKLDQNLMSSFPDLSSMKGLREIDLKSNRILKISEIPGHPNLESLDLSENLISEFSISNDFPKLDYLYLYENRISRLNIASLGLLNFLDLKDNRLTDLRGLSHQPNLEHLYIDRNAFTSLDSLSKLTRLKALSASGNDLVNLVGLESMHDLTLLLVNSNRITGLEEIHGLNSLLVLMVFDNKLGRLGLSRLPKLSSIDARDNQIETFDLRKLPLLMSVNLTNNLVSDLSGLKDLPSLSSLTLDGNPIDSSKNEQNCPTSSKVPAVMSFCESP